VAIPVRPTYELDYKPGYAAHRYRHVRGSRTPVL
jgi:hypothetical protein